jgi:hypothetical protein
MNYSKNALVINADSPLGIQVIRKTCLLGYHVTALAVDKLNDYHNPIKLINYTNPELKYFVNVQFIDPSILSDQDKIISSLNLLNNSYDLIISLNPTADVFEKWDLNLIFALYKKNLFNNSNTTIIIGRSSELTLTTDNKALENTVKKLGETLSKSNIDFIDFIKVGAIPGDEEFIADTYSNEILRKQFKVSKINSIFDIINYIIFYYIPGFLLSTILSIKNYIETRIPIKQKDD